ncbi:hypothetical protein T4D_5819 [Trichinella pseudospiralis]|uniref:Uncharacterized protein n=1 Tax=Trichinella pseudospiralis TaxID=6337 RepID=A0A0V1F4P3_TRIPS|nr:hypothetical protein T4D_5137 [Trichinella pseudospiralis]KRY81178.1 hypothetical protein T4D_5819 [Trichinella pseudospiralis]
MFPVQDCISYSKLMVAKALCSFFLFFNSENKQHMAVQQYATRANSKEIENCFDSEYKITLLQFLPFSRQKLN